MPAFPKVYNSDRLIRRIEINCDVNIHHFADTGRHVTVTAEIKVDLKGIGEHR